MLIPVCGQAIIALHVLLAITDSLPAHKIAFSVLCHVIYLQNFSDSWPLISLTSHSFVASCVLVVVDHFIWFFHFSRLTHNAHHAARQAYRGGPVVRPPAFGEMATFFAICVWLTPLFLFLSLSANDNTLPTSGESRHLHPFLYFSPLFSFLSSFGSPSLPLTSILKPSGPLDTASSPNVSSFPPSSQRPRASLFRLMMGFVPGLHRSSSRGAEVLIAPPSPGMPPYSPRSPSMRRPSTPLTPTRSLSYGEIELSDSTTSGLTPEFALGRPPPRRTASSQAANSLLTHPLSRRRGPDT